VKLDINIDFVDKCAWKRHQGKLIQEYWGGDYDPSYKHAIVRAAAEIGKQMGEGCPSCSAINCTGSCKFNDYMGSDDL